MSLRAAFTAIIISCLAQPASAQAFVHWETPHVHPMDITPDRSKLLVVNLADARLEVFNITSGTPTPMGSVPVGIDPCSVRARTNNEVWVVNHLSDSISIVDLSAMHVVKTILTADEPCDVVFAGAPQKAFVSISQLNEIHVYNAANPTGAAPTILPIEGEDPRELATDGSRIYAAIFEGGNKTTILSQNTVSSAISPYPGRPNPPPNVGTNFDPPLNPLNPTPPRVSLIVKQQTDGTWRDDNNADWSAAVTWGLKDHDVAIIDVNSLAITYATGLLNLNMALATRADGKVTVVGTDAINHIRFEPVLKSRFIRVNVASFDPLAPASPAITDLNPHLDYNSQSVPQNIRDLAIGDPRGIIWNSSGTTGYVTGMGSNNLLVIDANGARLARIELGEGPTGLALDEPRNRLYVVNKLAGSISIINTATNTELGRINYHDMTPPAVKLGRPLLYDTHASSGLGHISCASCHIDARMDQTSWDLGDPAGEVAMFDQSLCSVGFGGCEDFHPMKGPMATQTLVGLTNVGHLHWRGDRDDLAAFAPAFVGLQGRDAEPTLQQMQQFEDFLFTIAFPPNPNLNLDGSFPSILPNGGEPIPGRLLFLNADLAGPHIRCQNCHVLPVGTDGTSISRSELLTSQTMKTPHLRNVYEKPGFDRTSLDNIRGFGLQHDGATSSIFEYLSSGRFSFPPGVTGIEQKLDLEAYILCFNTGTHATTGAQITLSSTILTIDEMMRLDLILNQASAGTIGLIAKGKKDGIARGWRYNGGSTFQSDRLGETISISNLKLLAAPGAELTFTAVPPGMQTQLGIDRDFDGHLDRDEIDAGSNPANPNSTPGDICSGDVDHNSFVNVNDISYVVFRLGNSGLPGSVDGDADGNGSVNVNDISFVVFRLGTNCG